MLLVLLPLLPEVLIFAASTYAGAVGCQVDSKMACAVGPPSASEIIRAALQAAYFIGSKFTDDNIVVAWLASSYLLITLGWTRLSSRLLLELQVPYEVMAQQDLIAAPDLQQASPLAWLHLSPCEIGSHRRCDPGEGLRPIERP